MSKTREITKARGNLTELICSYISCARGIDDLDEEGDFQTFEDAIDSILETLLNKEIICA